MFSLVSRNGTEKIVGGGAGENRSEGGQSVQIPPCPAQTGKGNMSLDRRDGRGHNMKEAIRTAPPPEGGGDGRR